MSKSRPFQRLPSGRQVAQTFGEWSDETKSLIASRGWDKESLVPTYRRKYTKAGKESSQWAFRKVLRMPDGTKRYLNGVSAINTKAALRRLNAWRKTHDCWPPEGLQGMRFVSR